MLETVLYQYRGPYSNSSFPISDEKDFYHSGKGALQFSLLHLIPCTTLKTEQVSPSAPIQLCSGCTLSTQHHLPSPAQLAETLSRFYCMNIPSTDQDCYGMHSPKSQAQESIWRRTLDAHLKEDYIKATSVSTLLPKPDKYSWHCDTVRPQLLFFLGDQQPAATPTAQGPAWGRCKLQILVV